MSDQAEKIEAMTKAIQLALIPLFTNEDASTVMSALISATIRTGAYFMDCDPATAAQTVVDTIQDSLRTGLN